MKRRAAGIKGGTAEDARVQGWRAGAHALHLGHDLLVRLLERQVVAAAAAVVHRMPLVLHHLYRMTRCVNFWSHEVVTHHVGKGWAVVAWH